MSYTKMLVYYFILAKKTSTQAPIRNPQSATCNPKSAIRNPQSTVRNPQSFTPYFYATQ